MKIYSLYPSLPPTIDGIADYTAHQASTLVSMGEDVTILTAQKQWSPLPGVKVKRVFDGGGRQILEAAAFMESAPPDWLILQYNPLSYSGRFQVNPFLPVLLRRVKRQTDRTKVCLVLHEAFARFESGRVLGPLWQRLQLYLMTLNADLIVSAASTWCGSIQRWRPRVDVAHLPVGSNIPRSPTTREEARAQLGIENDRPVLGYFGSLGYERLPDHVSSIVQAASHAPRSILLYVGNQGDRLRALIADTADAPPLLDLGPCAPEQVSEAFSAMDVFFSLYRDGVSTRRGSFMTALQHGVPTVTTLGDSTDSLLSRSSNVAFLAVDESDPVGFGDTVLRLLQQKEERAALRKAATTLYRTSFDWPVTTAQLRLLLR
jgi:glycosyltransferase involved in cell wall biosynthesis